MFTRVGAEQKQRQAKMRKTKRQEKKSEHVQSGECQKSNPLESAQDEMRVLMQRSHELIKSHLGRPPDESSIQCIMEMTTRMLHIQSSLS